MSRRALLSVTDKSGVAEFARGLVARGFELISTGGTAAALRAAGLEVRDVAEVTGFPEMLGGRLKTLHPKVHGGLLALRDEPAHVASLAGHGIGTIDLVCVNLYAFREAAARPGAKPGEVVEQIDIGGPSMLRSAAKNHRFVWAVVDPADYARVLEALDTGDGVELRRELAGKVFAATAAYDAAIASWLAGADLPATLIVDGGRVRGLRYGENPHQRAALYVQPGLSAPCVAAARQLAGKELSYNNLIDADAALELVKEFEAPAAAVVKHTNPCGCAIAQDSAAAFRLAMDGDRQSAFGGILALNRPVDGALAALVADPHSFLEVVVAPEFSADAVEALTTRCRWGKNVRLLACGPLDAPVPAGTALRQIVGGLLVQDRDLGYAHEKRAVVSQRPPTEAETADLEFAWRVAKHVKSNAIVLARSGAVVGVGAGQMSRIDSVFMAGHKAGERSLGAVLASDAFFPFRDSLDFAAKMGVTAVIQPGGSVKDKDSISAADEHGLALVFTGVRHFRH